MPGHKAKRLGYAEPGNGTRTFAPGNTVGVVHGADSPRLYGPLAEVIAGEYLAMEGCPDYLRRPMFAGALRALCEAEAQEWLYLEWMNALPGDGKYKAKGAQSPPIDTWGRLAERSAARRRDCGLTPLTHARIGKALASAAVDVARLMAQAVREDGWDGGEDVNG